MFIKLIEGYSILSFDTTLMWNYLEVTTFLANGKPPNDAAMLKVVSNESFGCPLMVVIKIIRKKQIKKANKSFQF